MYDDYHSVNQLKRDDSWRVDSPFFRTFALEKNGVDIQGG